MIVQLLLSDGSTSLIEQGNMVVQRGSDHSWRNPSETDWASKSPKLWGKTSRAELIASLGWLGMVYVLLPAQAVVIKGEVLGDKSIH